MSKTKVTSDRIKEVDKKYWSPDERALGVHNLVANLFRRLESKGEATPTEIDMLSYHILSITRLAVAINDESLTTFARGLNLWMYEHHYNGAESIYGEPDKE